MWRVCRRRFLLVQTWDTKLSWVNMHLRQAHLRGPVKNLARYELRAAVCHEMQMGPLCDGNACDEMTLCHVML